MRCQTANVTILFLAACVFQQNAPFADEAKKEDPPQVRVVVQDYRPAYLETSDDGNLIVGRGAEYKSWHVFYVVDVARRKTLLRLNLPQKIVDVVIGPKGEWFAVTGRHTIYRVDISTGDYEVLLDNVSGNVVLNPAGDRLGVLGAFDGVTEHHLRDGGSKLGIYDLKERNWLAKCDTPILAAQEVWFEMETLVAYGLGGRVHSRRAFGGFRCDVRLNPDGDKPIVSAGREVWRPDHAGDGYTSPRALAARNETHSTSQELLKSIKNELTPDWHHGAQFVFLPYLAGDRKPDHDPVIKDPRARSGMLNIDRGGVFSVIPVDTTNSCGIREVDGRVLKAAYANHHYDEIAIEDAFSGNTVLEFPFQSRFNKITTSDYWMLTLSHGYLVHQPNKLIYYDLSTPKAVWEEPIDQHARKPYPYGTSRDGRYIFFGGRDTGPIAAVRSSKTGDVVFEVPRESGQSSYGAVPCLNDDGSEIACIHGNQLWIYSVSTGKRIHQEKFPAIEEAYFRYLAASGDKWIVGSEYAGSMILDLNKGTSVKTSLPEAIRAVPVRARSRECLLIETQPGKAAIVDIDNGRVYAEWYVGAYQGGGSMPEGPPRAFTAFNGKLLVRRTAHRMDLELIDLRTLAPIVSIHPIPANDGVGWIAVTPDGYWDASPGAEHDVEVFSGKHDLAKEKNTRRAQDNRGSNRSSYFELVKSQAVTRGTLLSPLGALEDKLTTRDREVSVGDAVLLLQEAHP